ncbi:MAG: nuclear transport factor 2 family protein [Acidobacteriia bacterium]|nr:nuclear transport factor 2 family protein [Terriglobia bacterium]
MWGEQTVVSGVAALLFLMSSPALPAWSAGSLGEPDERLMVERIARDYFEGWYTADPERMARALHPDMVKRYVDALPGGRQVVHSATRDLMIEMTRAGGGAKVPAGDRNIAVQVLEVSGDIAVARASSSEYYEYLSLAKCNGKWVIVNILWRFQASGSHPR